MKINSDPSFLKELFSTEIYSISDPSVITSPEVEEEAMLISFQGDGTSGVAIFVPEKATSSENEFLKKILSSIQLTTKSIALFTGVLPNTSDALKDLQINKVISFGLDIELNNDFIHIPSASLSELIEQVSLKRELWSQLKANF